MDSSGEYYPMKKFVKGSDNDEREATYQSNATKANCSESLDARKAYEEIIGDTLNPKHKHEGGLCENAQSQPLPLVKTYSAQSRSSQPPTLTSLMKYAELNDCERVMDGLDQDSSLINSVDQFGWSLLMVAACAGALQVVELLLSSGANTKLRDKSGFSCISLAKKRGQADVVEKILKFRTVNEAVEIPETPVKEEVSHKVELCPACNVNVTESNRKTHLTSTIHQMSQCKKCKTHYSISGSNRGYQLMLKNGWDGENGLGPSGRGLKFPPKTTLKRDRKGLGLSKGAARITHFSPNDIKAVAKYPLPKRHENKRKLKQRLDREKQLEFSLRRELS